MDDNNETIVKNKETITEETTVAAPADSISDDIEYTLLLNEVTDLTIPLPGVQPEEHESAAEDVSEEEAATVAEAEEEAADGAEAGSSGDEEAEKGASEEKTAESEEKGEDKAEYGLPAGHSEMGELAEKIAARRRYNERKKKRFRTRFYVIMTVLILGILFLILSLSSIFTVDSIEVRGNSHYTAEEIINMGHAVPGRNLIYNLNKQEIEEYLLQNPYIKEARVTRKLPSTMVIKVTERQERLAFKYDDDYLIMDEEGILLKKTRNKPMTTLAVGVVVSKIKLGEKVGTTDNGQMDRLLELVQATTASDLFFVKLDIANEKKVKAYIYDTLIVKTDYDTLMTNIENGRLHMVVQKLLDDGIKRGTITFDDDGNASFMPAI